jgi:hypothetical protein
MNHIISYHRWQRSSLATILLAGFLLLISPLSAVAQSIGWSPDDMFFESTVIGTTATQTLTLANEDAVGPLTVWSIEWIYNEPGEITWTPSYEFVANPPAPVILMPGESMEIDITFTAESWSFKMANLLITNSSFNASSLNYFVMGDGVEGDPCAPMTTCDGTCIDTTSDLNNCGSCGNVCPTPENAIATCETSACNFICDDGYEPVGNLCFPIVVDPTLDEMMIDLLTFIHQSLDDGTLVGFGPGASAQNRLDVLLKWLGEADDYIININPDTGEPEPELVSACEKLNEAHLRCDGGYPFRLPPDFIAGESTIAVNSKILNIIDAIEGCEADAAITRPVK